MQRDNKKRKFNIIDPRDSSDAGLNDTDSRRAQFRHAREMGFMILECYSRYLTDEPSHLIRKVLLQFPSEKIYMSFDAPYKACLEIMDCVRPEQTFDHHTGFSSYSQGTVERFSECFRRFEGWFYWSFGVFEAQYAEGLSKEAISGLVRFRNVHAVQPFVDYTIYVGDEYTEIIIICYRESLFDEFLVFAESVRFKST